MSNAANPAPRRPAAPPATAADVVAFVAGASSAEEAARVHAALAASERLRALERRVAAHWARYDVYPEAPPTPTFEALWSHIESGGHAPAAARRGFRKWPPVGKWAVGTAALVLAALGVVLVYDRPPSMRAPTTAVSDSAVRANVNTRAVPRVAAAFARPAERPSAGSPWLARQTAEVALALPATAAQRGGTARTTFRAGSLVEWPADDGDANAPNLTLHRGAVWCVVDGERGPLRFTVAAAGKRIEVRGTRFEVSLDNDALAVRVDEGSVEVVGVATVLAGDVWLEGTTRPGAKGVPTWLPAPTLTLAATAGLEESPDATREVVALELATDPALGLDFVPLARGGPAAWVEWMDADGRALASLPIRAENVLQGPSGPLAGAQEPGTPPSRVQWVLGFERPAGLPSTYRLRALLRPRDASPWIAEALDLESPR